MLYYLGSEQQRRCLYNKSEESTRYKGIKKFEPPHDKTNKMACAPSEDSDQPVHSVGS